MSAWTLWIVLFLSDGGITVMEGRSYTTQSACAQVSNYVRTMNQSGIRKAIPVCKKTINL